MENVLVSKARLVETVQANRDAHRAVFEEALAGWNAAVTMRLQEMTEQALAGKLVDLAIRLPRPEDHTPDYDRVLAMFDFSVEDVLELSERDFTQYVLDDWGWKQQFLTTASSYGANG